MTEPDVSVIIVNYNGHASLGACLAALHADPDPARETIVVDNASRDASVSMVETEYPGVRVLTLSSNLGFAGGNNAGARVARGRRLAFLNNDTVPRPGWSRWLSDALQRSDAAMATARIVMLDDPERVDSAGDGYLRAGGAFKHGHGGTAADAARSRDVFGACGAAFMIRRELFEAVGGFDEDFFMVYEDVDLSYRLQLGGHRCRYVAEAVVEHVGSATLGHASASAVFFGQRNLEWVYVKNTPWPPLVRSLPSHALYGVAAAFHFASIGRLRPFLSAKWHALRGLPTAWRKRRVIQRERTRPARELWALMEPRWLVRKWREKQVVREPARTR